MASKDQKIWLSRCKSNPEEGLLSTHEAAEVWRLAVPSSGGKLAHCSWGILGRRRPPTPESGTFPCRWGGAGQDAEAALPSCPLTSQSSP